MGIWEKKEAFINNIKKCPICNSNKLSRDIFGNEVYCLICGSFIALTIGEKALRNLNIKLRYRR